MDCPLSPFVSAEYREEAFRCQHINEQGWELAAQEPGLAERYAARLLHIAEELEAVVASSQSLP